MKTIKTLFLIFAIIVSLPCYSQAPNVENILPNNDVNRTIRKIGYTVMGIGSTVHVDINCDINNYSSCNNDNILGRLDVEVNWYNTNDETGKMMLQMIKDLQTIPQEMADFKTSSGFEMMDQAKEVSIDGGKYWIYTKQKPCINEISGPTGKTEHQTQIRCYIFDGIKIIKIDLKGFFEAEKAKEIMQETDQNIKKFDFSTLSNVVISN